MNEYRMTLVWIATPVSATNPRPDETLKLVPVRLRATRPPTGAVTSTLNTIIRGSFRLPYKANRISRINTTVSGRISAI